MQGNQDSIDLNSKKKKIKNKKFEVEDNINLIQNIEQKYMSKFSFKKKKKKYMSNNLSIYIIYKRISLFGLDFYVIQNTPKPQPGKDISPNPLKMPTKYDIFLLIHIFKTNLSKIYPKKKDLSKFFYKRKK